MQKIIKVLSTLGLIFSNTTIPMYKPANDLLPFAQKNLKQMADTGSKVDIIVLVRKSKEDYTHKEAGYDSSHFPKEKQQAVSGNTKTIEPE